MRRELWLPLFFLLAGCGVSKDLYQAELSKSQELETRGRSLEARLADERARGENLGKQLSDLDGRHAALAADLDQALKRNRELEAQLLEGDQRAASLTAALATERGARSEAGRRSESLDSERIRLITALEAEKSARNRAEERLRVAEGEIAALATEKKRLEQEKTRSVDDTKRSYEELLEAMKGEVAKGQVTISQLQGKLTVNVMDEILFDSGSARVKPSGMEVLQRVGEALKGISDKAVLVEGHTDNVAIGGELAKRYPTNWELSAARATSVVRYLQDQAGLDPLRLATMGFGEHRPVAPNDTPEGRQKNRRIEIKLVPVEAPLVGVPSQPEPGERPLTQ
jgi:chemotaxis protein MotB